MLINNILIFALMFFNIFLAFPIILKNIYQKKESVFLLALFFAIIGFYFRPQMEMYDIYRYYHMFDFPQELEIFLKFSKDKYVEHLINLIKEFNLPKYFLGFTSAFILYYFLFKSFFKNLKIKDKKKYFLAFIVFLSSIPILAYTGIRFFPATAVFIYSIFLYFEKNKRYIIFMGLALFIHFSLIIPIFIFVVYVLFVNKLSIKILKICAIVSFFIGILLNQNLIIEIVKILHKILNREIVDIVYLTGQWGTGYLSSFNMIGFIVNFTIINLRKIILFLYIFIMDKKNEMNKYILMIITFDFIIQQFFVPSERYFFIAYYMILILNAKKIEILKRNKWGLFYRVILLYNFIVIFFDIKDHYLSLFVSYANIFKISILDIFILCIKNY